MQGAKSFAATFPNFRIAYGKPSSKATREHREHTFRTFAKSAMSWRTSVANLSGAYTCQGRSALLKRLRNILLHNRHAFSRAMFFTLVAAWQRRPSDAAIINNWWHRQSFFCASAAARCFVPQSIFSSQSSDLHHFM